MRQSTWRTIEDCLFALNTEYTPEEREELSLPPYPLPARLAKHHEVVSAEVDRLRREDFTERICVTTTMARPEPWENLARRLPQRHGDDFFETALTLVFAAGEISTEEAEAVVGGVPNAIARNKLRSQIVHALVGRGDLADAHRVSESFEPFHGLDQRFFGHRIIARGFAERGRAGEFFKLWPRLAAGKERDYLGELKGTLVASVAREAGWEAAVGVVADKRVGPAYSGRAFEPLARGGEVDLLLEIFSGGETGLDDLGQLAVLATALAAKAKTAGEATVEPFTRILHRVIALEASDRAVMRARDQLLLSLWPAYPDAAALALARKAARAPRVKAELKTLHPEVTRPAV